MLVRDILNQVLEGGAPGVPSVLRLEKEAELARRLEELAVMMPGRGRVALAYVPEEVKRPGRLAAASAVFHAVCGAVWRNSETDLKVIMGLCVGRDSMFIKYAGSGDSIGYQGPGAGPIRWEPLIVALILRKKAEVPSPVDLNF